MASMVHALRKLGNAHDLRTQKPGEHHAHQKPQGAHNRIDPGEEYRLFFRAHSLHRLRLHRAGYEAARRGMTFSLPNCRA